MNVNLKSVLEIGLKIAVAVGAGIAVFAGVQSATNSKTKLNNNQQSPRFNPGQPQNNEVGIQGVEALRDEVPQQQSQAVVEVSGSEKMVAGLRATTETCNKLLGFSQSLAIVVENLANLFSNNSNSCYYNNNWGYSQPTGVTGFNRINPFIVEATPVNNGMYCQGRYPF